MSQSPIPAQGSRPGSQFASEIVSGRAPGALRCWVEIPDPAGFDGAWCYSDEISYLPGDRVGLFVSATVPHVRVRIVRDPSGDEVLLDEVVDVAFQAVPERAYETGCDWTETIALTLDPDVTPGAYLVELSSVGATSTLLGHHLVVVKPSAPRPGALALVLATSTWTAYNDWGGASHYFGVHPGVTRGRSPILSQRRPWARGQVWLPDGAPRVVNERPLTEPVPARYEAAEWAYLNGYSKYYASAGWATYERFFVAWAESQGYTVDLYTQNDLHEGGCLDGHACAVFVGHDEYWSTPMRDAVDAFVDSGGRVARFAGNFMWQVRLDPRTQVQTAYKYDAREHDPYAQTDPSLMTGAWEDIEVGNPGATTFGVNALRGLYAGFGGMAPRAGRGFIVFREDHWSLEGTGLGYAELLGDSSRVYAFEMDGVEYEFRGGLPFPLGTDGAPDGLEIVAMNWATGAERGLSRHADSLMLGDADAQFRARVTGADPDESRRTSGMVVNFSRGRGEVFTAATCEWVNGLRLRDFYVETVTRNVLDRYLGRG